MQDAKDMEEATGEKQNCSTIYSQNKHTQEASGRKPEADVFLSVQRIKTLKKKKNVEHLLNLLNFLAYKELL